MSLAYCCDGPNCSERTTIDVSMVNVVPNGWIALEVTRGTGQMNNQTQKKHLCPKCASGFERGLRADPQLGR